MIIAVGFGHFGLTAGNSEVRKSVTTHTVTNAVGSESADKNICGVNKVPLYL